MMYAQHYSLRLGAVPQATSLPEGGIWGSLMQGNDTGRVREVTILDQLGAKMSAATRRRALPAKSLQKIPLPNRELWDIV